MAGDMYGRGGHMWQGGHAWQGGTCRQGGMCGRGVFKLVGMSGRGASMAGGVRGRRGPDKNMRRHKDNCTLNKMRMKLRWWKGATA